MEDTFDIRTQKTVTDEAENHCASTSEYRERIDVVLAGLASSFISRVLWPRRMKILTQHISPLGKCGDIAISESDSTNFYLNCLHVIWTALALRATAAPLSFFLYTTSPQNKYSHVDMTPNLYLGVITHEQKAEIKNCSSRGPLRKKSGPNNALKKSRWKLVKTDSETPFSHDMPPLGWTICKVL